MENAIVFCSDRVGTETLDYLFSNGEQIDVIVLTRETAEIERLARRNDVECIRLYENSAALAAVRGRRFRWLLNLWGTMVLNVDALSMAERRVNIHPGLVPDTRGSDCATWVIRYDIPAGVSLMDMTAEIDAGGVYASAPLDAVFPVRGVELAERLKDECIELFKREWLSIRDGNRLPVPQSGQPRTFRRADTIADRTRDLEQEPETREALQWLLAHDFAPHSRPRVRIGERTFEVTLTLDEVE